MLRYLIKYMKYRIANYDDITDLVRLRIKFLKEVSNEHVSDENLLAVELKKYFEKHLTVGDYINWLATDEAKIVATGGICFHSYPPSFTALNERRAYIMNIYTISDFRNQGIASVIFDKLMEEAASRDVCIVSLHATNMGKALYQKFGFEHGDDEMIINLLKNNRNK